jgi:hypothetical protein
MHVTSSSLTISAAPREEPAAPVPPRLPFASLSFWERHPSPAAVKEKRTGTVFQGEFCLRSGQRGACPHIVGMGVRSKRLAGIKNLDVYALALYVDEGFAKGALRRKFPAGTAVEDVARQQSTLFGGKTRGLHAAICTYYMYI